MSAPKQQGSPCFSDADCVVTGGVSPICRITGPAGSVGECSRSNQPDPTAAAAGATGTAGKLQGGGGGNGIDTNTIIIAVAAVVVGALVLSGLIWIARLKGLWPFTYLNRRFSSSDDDDDELDTDTSIRALKPKPTIDYKRSTLVPAEMASPLYQPAYDTPPLTTKQGDHPNRASLYGHANHRMSMFSLAPPPQEMIPALPAAAYSVSSSGSTRRSHAATPPQQQLHRARPDEGPADALLRQQGSTPFPAYLPLPIGTDNPYGLRFFFKAFGRTYIVTLDTVSGNFRFDHIAECEEYYAKLHDHNLAAAAARSTSPATATASISSSAAPPTPPSDASHNRNASVASSSQPLHPTQPYSTHEPVVASPEAYPDGLDPYAYPDIENETPSMNRRKSYFESAGFRTRRI
ncbi:hypothetical protein DFJ77DRAFT_472779 [Powellomyces hirtus]|nr:hypothetical protein DFJ77DRAFT_472779 [Powellomyces hirtus]